MFDYRCKSERASMLLLWIAFWLSGRGLRVVILLLQVADVDERSESVERWVCMHRRVAASRARIDTVAAMVRGSIRVPGGWIWLQQ